MRYYSTLANVRLWYDRRFSGDYGGGAPTTFAMEDALEDALYETFSTLWAYWGPPEAILSAGAFVNKPGWHGKGLAFDLDGFMWHKDGKEYVFVCTNYELSREIYLGIESLLRASFEGTILNRNYNEAHRNHWHLQLDGVYMFRKLRSQVVYLQDTLNCFGHKLKIDGVYGPKTAAALKATWGGEFVNGEWTEFLFWAGEALLFRHSQAKAPCTWCGVKSSALSGLSLTESSIYTKWDICPNCVASLRDLIKQKTPLKEG